MEENDENLGLREKMKTSNVNFFASIREMDLKGSEK